MAKRYFAVNSLAGMKRTSTLIFEATTASRFDSSYVPNAVVIPIGDVGTISRPFLDGSTSITGDLWLRFDLWTSFSSNNLIVTMNSGGISVYRLWWQTSTVQIFQYWNSASSTWVNWGSAFSVSLQQNVLQTIVIHVVLNTSFEIFVGGTSVASSAVAPTSGASSVDEFRFAGITSGGGVGSYFSQIMCADYDLRNSHMMTATLNGNSTANTGGTGSYTDINETVLDESTAEIITTVGNKMGQTKASTTVPSAYSIASLVINVRGRVSGGIVTDGKLGVRSGGTNYSSTGLGFNSGYEPRSYEAATDPATSTAWTQTSFNNAETYIEAA